MRHLVFTVKKTKEVKKMKKLTRALAILVAVTFMFGQGVCFGEVVPTGETEYVMDPVYEGAAPELMAEYYGASESEDPEPNDQNDQEYEIAYLRQMLDAALKDLIAAIDALDDAPSEVEIDGLKQEYFSACAECGNLQVVYEMAEFVFEAAYGRVVEASDEVNRTFEEVEGLRHSLGELEGAISEVTAALAEAQTDEEREELQSLLDAFYEAIPNLVSELQHAEVAYGNALQVLAAAEANCEAANREKNAMHKLLTEAEEKRDEALGKWHGAQSELDEAWAAIDQAREEYDSILDMLIAAGGQ